MTAFTVAGDRHVFLTHMAFYGLAGILEDGGVEGLTLRWDGATALVESETLGASMVGEVVRSHARAHADEGSWVARDATIDGSRRGLMSPRLSVFAGDDTWRDVQGQRNEVLNDLTGARAWLDLRMIAALGEPSYWSCDREGKVRQDDGASRLEMQPRNSGSEFVATRLRKLATAVAGRPASAVAAGLDGTHPVDEIGDGSPGSMTATGLSLPGPVDNALAWCALWGISGLPLAPRVNGVAATSGHIGRNRREWFYAPVWSSGWRPARLRTVLASKQLQEAAAAGLMDWALDEANELGASAWLRARGVIGLVRYEIRNFGTGKASARRALYGENLALRGGRR